MAQRSATLSRRFPQFLAKRFPVWLSSPTTLTAAILFLGFGIGVVFGGYFFTREDLRFKTLIHEVYSNFGIELISIGLTVVVIDGLNRRRAEQERKEELILQMGSKDSVSSLEAVRLLRHKSWLTDGSLRKAYLVETSLPEADLFKVDLQEGDLVLANLQRANFGGNANLRKANFSKANLQEANLGGADLSEALLYETNL